MADWGGGYTSEIAISRIDTGTWTASSVSRPVDSLTINRSCMEAVPLIESATLQVTGEFENGWYQAHIVTGPDSREKVPLGAFLFERTSANDDYGTDTVSASGSSVLRPADGTKLVTGEYAPMGADGASYAASLLQRAVLAPVNVEGGFTLAQHVVFGVGMSCLEAAWLILDAGGYCIQLDGDGTVNIRPKPTEAAIDLERLDADLLIPGVTSDMDFANVKNRYYALDGGMVAVAENVSDGPASYDSRKYWDDVVDTAPIRVNGETLQAYAERKLAEQMQVRRKMSYTREFYPGVTPFSVVGLRGYNLTVVSQSLQCDYGVTVNETTEVVA